MRNAEERRDSMMYSEGHGECWRQSLSPNRKPSVSTVTGTARWRQMHERRPAGHNGGVWGRRSGVPFPFCQRFQLSPSTLGTIYEHDLPTCAAPVLSPEPNLSHPPNYIKPLPQAPR